MRRTLKAVAGLCVLLGTLFIAGGGAAPAGAQECGGYFGPPCEEDVLEVEYPTCIESGDPFAVNGSVTPADAESAGEDVEFTVDGVDVGTLDIADDGTFSGNLTAPVRAVGEYTFTAATGELEASGPIDVCTDVGSGGAGNPGGGGTNTAGGGSGPLARTGFDATPMVTLGAAVLILGAAAVYGSKRRRIA